jgi:CDP-diacylglycerol---serine O-phosphatidyltransferase
MALTLKAVTQLGKKRYKKSLSIIPYFFTFANALFGFLSVIAALKGNFVLAASYIGLAACMDACDGRLARAFGSASYLGAELDGLCDAVSFCCAPPILLYCFYQDIMGMVGLIILSSYLCAGLFRLAKFNTTPSPYNGYFSGLSTPVSAFFLASLIVYYDWIKFHNMSWLLHPTSIFILVIILSLLMLSTIPFPSFKNYKLCLSSCYIYLVPVFCLLLICWKYHLPTIFLAISLYIVSSLLYWIFSASKQFLNNHRE